MDFRRESPLDGVARQANQPTPSRPVLSGKDRERFRQLLALARDGDECAASDLFKEFDYVFSGGAEGSGHDAD